MSPGGGFEDEAESVSELVTEPHQMRSNLRAWARSQPVFVRIYRFLRFGETRASEPPVSPLPRIRLSDQVQSALAEYDVVYFPWPRHVVPPKVPGALVATFHDFNHRHQFGNYLPEHLDEMDAEMVEWLGGKVQPIASTRFIAQELDAFYPMRTNAPRVVYLSTFATSSPSPSEVNAVVGHFCLPPSYLLCPTNISPHKNLVRLLRAVGDLRRRGVDTNLVLTGSGTQCIGVDPTPDPLYATNFRVHIDEANEVVRQEGLSAGTTLFPLGYVTDAQMDALVKGADLVVAPSMYEAGSGPALDAWQIGTPVVSSALPSVIEQIQFLGTEAVLFDPQTVADMVESLGQAAANPELMGEMALRSRAAMSGYTWDDVANGYLEVFRKAAML